MSKKLFLPYLLAQYPSPQGFDELFDLTTQYADGIEIGIPFSDPVADGPVIQEATSRVLAQGFRVESLFRMLQRKRLEIPIALMTYANPILAYGRDAFFTACKDSGVTNLIVPDVPFEESGDWKTAAHESGLVWISFISLVTREPRLQQIASSAEGFIYLLSLTGITGADIRSTEQIRKTAAAIRSHTNVPIALGFGIKSPEDVIRFRETVDAFIVGSRIIQQLSENPRIDSLQGLLREFRSVISADGARC
jgi:tryptophan synthase alpha chain